jgi:hypothetical protein
MRNRVRVALIAAVVAVAGVVAFQALRPQAREPVYQGKPLSFWLDGLMVQQAHLPPRLQRSAEESEMAEQAIRQIGTNAIPTLLKMLRNKNSVVVSRLVFTWERYVRPMRHVPAWFQYPPWWRHRAAFLHQEATSAFVLLGTNAQQAVPELIRINEQNIPPTEQLGMFLALRAIGPEALRIGVPVFLRRAASSNPFERELAVEMLASAGVAPELVVPALLKALGDKNLNNRVRVAQGLGRFGTNAQQAVPALTLLLNDPDFSLRYLATNTLKAIDPAAAARAGVQ